MDEDFMPDLVRQYLRLLESFEWWLDEAADQDMDWADLFVQQEKSW